MKKTLYQQPLAFVKPIGGRSLMAAASTVAVGGTSDDSKVSTPDDAGWAKSHSLWEDDEVK